MSPSHPTSPARAGRDLSALFDPRSVAVVGASDDTAKWGHHVARQLLAADNGRVVHLVNRRGGTVLGRTASARLTDVEGPVDLVAICVPAAGFLDAVDDALVAGARAIVAITAGLSEASEDGRRIEAEAVRRVRAAGAVLVGPNCLGVVDTTTSLALASDPLTAGSVAVLSQSGNLVIDVDDLLGRHGLGISRFVSLGNQADIALAELMDACVDHAGTSAVAVYAEDMRVGREFVAAARSLAAAGKPVVLLAPGRSAAAARGAASHTGALTSPSRVIDAACAAGGVRRVDTPSELVDVLAALAGGRLPLGRRTAVLTDGGGHGAVASDAATAVGLDVAVLSDPVRDTLRRALGERAGTANPVDLAGAGEQDPGSYARGVAALLASDEVDSVLWVGYFGGYAEQPGTLGPREVAAAHEAARIIDAQRKPVVLQSIFPESPSVRVLREAGVPVYRGIREAAVALAALHRERSPAELDPLELPDSATPMVETGYVAVRELLVAHGIEFPDLVVVRNDVELRTTLTSGVPRFPVVLKAMGLQHKSDSGGVVLDLPDQESVLAAYRDLVGRLAPPAVAVESMADVSGAIEVIAGVHHDRRFGPVVMVGLGGVLTEVLSDVAFALAPASPETVEALLLSLRGAALFGGVRGRPRVDVTAAARLVSRLSAVAAAHPELEALEINPVLVGPAGAIALDARAVRIPDPVTRPGGTRSAPGALVTR